MVVIHLDLLMVVTNLSLSLAHGGDKLYRDLLMVVSNLTLRIAHGGDKPYTVNCS